MASYTITCAACGAANRIPSEREGQVGRCGVCRKALAPLYVHPQALSAATFDPFIRAYPGPVLAEFWAPW